VSSAPDRASPDVEVVTGVAEDGSCIAVTLGRPALAELRRRWPPLGLRRVDGQTLGPVERSVLIGAGPDGPEVLVDGRPSTGGWDRVESELGLFAAERLAESVAVHAAVIEVEQGVIVVPGRSGVGKTTLCMAARAAGLRVWSDEYALVDVASGAVGGWPRSMRVRTAGGPVRVALDEQTELIGQLAAPVLVAVVEHDPGGPGLRSLTSGEVVMGLLANTVCAERAPDRSLTAALAVAAVARGVGGTRGEAEAAIGELVRLTRG
jgi:hypothetical protein